MKFSEVVKRLSALPGKQFEKALDLLTGDETPTRRRKKRRKRRTKAQMAAANTPKRRRRKATPTAE